MQFKFFYIFALMVLGTLLVNGAGTQPQSTCWNPTPKSYSSWAEFAKEFGSKFDKTNIAGLGDAKDSAQAFECAASVFKWLKTFGASTYWLDVFNETSGVIRVFGGDIGINVKRKGEIVNYKGYFIWRQKGVCKITRFGNNSSKVINENIQIKDDGLYGGPRERSYKLKSCVIYDIDNELCDKEFLTPEQEAYVFTKWVHKMKLCGTTFARPAPY